MKLHKRKKPTRHRGTRTAGWAMKKHKGGKGNSGGKGMAGTGKRGDQKKSWVIKYQYPYFGKKGFTSKKTLREKNNVYNLDDVSRMAENGMLEIKNYKVLGQGEISTKVIVHAKAFSNSAREKIEAAGGEAIVVSKTGRADGKEEETEKKTPVKKAIKKEGK